MRDLVLVAGAFCLGFIAGLVAQHVLARARLSDGIPLFGSARTQGQSLRTSADELARRQRARQARRRPTERADAR